MWIIARNAHGRPTLMHRGGPYFTECGFDVSRWSLGYVSDQDAEKLSVMLCKNCKKGKK